MKTSTFGLFARSVAAASLAGVLTFAAIGTAGAQTKIRIGTQPSLAMLPIKYGLDEGLFKAAGLEIELIRVQPGPPVTAALMAKEIDAGWVASIPIILARANGLPLKLFANTAAEHLPDHPAVYFVTTKASGITRMADMKGKTVMINANGAACELALRDHLGKAGTSWDDVKKVVVPFPQMQAALELGNADLACTIDIFFAAMTNSDKIRSEPVAVGISTIQGKTLFGNGFAAREDWLLANKETVAKFMKAYGEAIGKLAASKDDQVKLAETYANIPKALIPKLELVPFRPEGKVSNESVQPFLDQMNKVDMLKGKKITAADVVFSDY